MARLSAPARASPATQPTALAGSRSGSASMLSTPSKSDSLKALVAGANLTRTQTELLFGALVRGELSAGETAALLLALRYKGETADELAGAATALIAAAVTFPAPDG